MSARVLPKSTAQREEEIMQAHQYKSKPVDHRIFESMGDMGVPKVKSRPLTEPVDIHFHSDERMALRSEERELKAVQEAKKKEQERMRKCKKNVEKMKFTVKHPMKTAVRSTKELTIPKTPTSRLDARHGTKFLSTARLVCDDDEDRSSNTLI
jgi:hypothetical protein